MASNNTILKNVVRFTGLVANTPVVLPHLLNINGFPVIPDLVAGNAPGFEISANDTTVTVTRTTATSGDVDVYLEHWHTIEEVVPPDKLAGKIPFIISSGDVNTGPIAAAFVNAFNGGAEFLSQFGFLGPVNRSAAGVYTLTLENPPPSGPNSQFQLVVTALLTGGGIPGGIAWIFAGPISNSMIQVGIRTFNPPDNEPIDGQFMIVVHVAPLVVP